MRVDIFLITLLASGVVSANNGGGPPVVTLTVTRILACQKGFCGTCRDAGGNTSKVSFLTDCKPDKIKGKYSSGPMYPLTNFAEKCKELDDCVKNGKHHGGKHGH